MGCKTLLLQILIKHFRGFSSMVDRSGEFSLFRDIHVANGSHLYFPKAYRHIHRTAGTFRGVKLDGTNQAGTGDIIMLRSDFKKRNSL